MSASNYIPINIDIATINTIGLSKNVFLPATSSIYGKTISIKDITGYAATNNIIIRTQGTDSFQDATSNFIINRNFGVASFFAKSNTWYLLNSAGGQADTTLYVPIIYTSSIFASTLYGDGTNVSNIHFGVSTISSILSYGLSSVNGGPGISSLSSLISYGLSSVYSGAVNPGVSTLSTIISYGLSSVAGGQGISSLSSIVSYGLSSVAGGQGISSLSSIVSYGLSTVAGGQGISSLSSIVSYGLSSVGGGQGISSLSSIVSYGLSSVGGGQGISSLSSIISYGLSSVSGGRGISSLSSIISYGLSSVAGGQGISSLSSIVSYGLSSVTGGQGISSLSSIVSYGLSSVNAGQGISSLSSIVSYGLSSVSGIQGISSLSSIISYGLSTVARQPDIGLSTISSIVSYGLSSVNGGFGISSVSSILSYGLSTLKNYVDTTTPTLSNSAGPGVSTLSTIVSYGLSSVNGGQGISSLSSILSYGLSSVAGGQGISSLSSIVSYGLSSVYGGQGISSISSILSYGLSSVNGGQGISSLSSIVSYGLSSVNGGFGISSLSSIVAYGLSTIRDIRQGISSLSSVVSFGLSSVNGGQGISSLSSLIAYGLSSVSGGQGISSLSSIVSYGLSSVSGGQGISSLSSIISYGLSSVSGSQGISSLSSIISYGLSSVNGGRGISSLSSIVSYGLSSVNGSQGISSLSSIVSYGLSSVNGGQGISSLSSIVSYGLSSVNGGQGISSLSSIVSYGLSSVNGGRGISSLSSIISYGLSSVNGGQGLSSLSSIVSYGLSSVVTSQNTYAIQSIIYADNNKSYIYTNNNTIQIGSLAGLPVLYYGYSGTLWVAAAFTNNGLYYSRDGNAWSQATFIDNPVPKRFNYVTYQNNTWVALAKDNSNTACIYYSSNGTTWLINSNLSLLNQTSNVPYSINYGNRNWILFTATSSPGGYSAFITTNISNGTFSGVTPFSGPNAYAFNGVYNAGTWVSVGQEVIAGKFYTVKYSIDDGVTWSNALNADAGVEIFAVGYSVINVNNVWIVGGQQRGATGGFCPIFQSIDGRSFTGIRSQDTSNILNFKTIIYDSIAKNYYALAQYGTNDNRVIVSSNGYSNWNTLVNYTPYATTARGLALGYFNFTVVTLDIVNNNIVTSNTIVTSNIYANYFYGDGSGLSNLGVEVSTLSSIVSYGLSSVMGGQGISSLSSIVSYGLSSISGGQGISSLSSILSYGLSSIKEYVDTFSGGSGSNAGYGISSLSSIVSYGLSSLWSPDGLSSLSTVTSYGLSSMIQSSLTVTTIGPMKEYSIGGIGLSTLDTPPTDTITNAFAKVDSWLFRNLVDSPPAPASNALSIFSNTGRFTYQTFDPPFQFKSAFIPNLWLPSIFSINVDIISSNGSRISCNITEPQYLPSSGLPLSGLYFDSQRGSYPRYPFTYSNGATVISNLYYINICNFIGTVDNPYTVDIYYSNYSAQPVRKLESQWFIFRGGAPSAPYSIFFNGVNATTAYANFTLSNSDSTDPTNNAGFTNAITNVFFSNVGGYPRRYNVNTGYYDSYSNIINTDISGSNSGNTVRVSYTGLPPDTPLSFNVYTLNSFSDQNGALSSNSAVVRTSLPNLVGGRLTYITNDSSLWGANLYARKGLIYSNITYGPIDVYNWNAMSGTTIYEPGIRYLVNYTTWGGPNPIQIHTQSNPGSAATNIASFSVVLPNIESNIFTFAGFPNTTTGIQSSNTTNTTIWVGQINDSYLGDINSSNFYLNTEFIFVNILSNYFSTSPKAEPYYYTFIHSNASNPTVSITASNYANGIVGAPIVNSLSNYKNISNAGTYGWVSGVLVLSNTVAFDFNLDILNFADYFYPAITSFGTVNLSNGAYVTATSNIYSNTVIYNSNDSTTWSLQVPSPARFKLSNFTFSPTVPVWTSNGVGIQANITFENLAASGYFMCNVQYYFDTPSLTALNTTFSNSKAIGGARQESASNSYNTTVIPYDNSQLIVGNTCNNYNSEIAFVGGSFRFNRGISSNYDYFGNFLPVSGFPTYSYPTSYTGLQTENRIRYATFKYSLSNSGTNFVKLLQFAIANLSGVRYTPIQNCNFVATIVPTLWYKISNAGAYNTGWLDGNTTKNSYLAFNSLNAVNGAAGLRSNDIYTPIVNSQRFFSIIPIPASCNYDVYVKIGLSNGGTSVQAQFDYIYLNQINGSTPSAPTGLNVTQTVNSGATFTFNALWANDSVNVPIISNTVVTSNLVVAGFPCRWVPSGVNYSNEIVSLNIGGVNNATYNLLNANTQYTISVTSLNDVGLGAVATTTYTTAFPTTYSNFYDSYHSIRISSQPNIVYTYSSGVAIGTRLFATNIINCNIAFGTNRFVTFDLYDSNTTSNAPITFNYESTQAGSNLCNVSLYLTGTVNTTTTTSQLTFSNQFYSNTSLTALNGSGGSGLTMTLSNLTDRWVSNPTITGFYYTGKVGFVGSNFITASNYGYTFTLSNNSGSSLVSPSFYFDNLSSNVAPAVNSVFVDSSVSNVGYYSYVSGVPVFNINCNYNFWIQALNLGSLYFASPPVRVSLSNNNYNSNFPFNSVTTPFYSAASTGSTQLTTRVANAQNNTFFFWSNVSVASAAPAFTFSNPLTVSASACNLNSNSATSSFGFMNSNSELLYTDSASIAIRDATKDSNWIGVPSYGARVESGSGLYPDLNLGMSNTTLFGAVYSDTDDLILSYSNELQLVNGSYTGSNQYAYLNYTVQNLYDVAVTLPKYQGAYTTGGIRYTTFMWYMPSDGVQYSQVEFTINGNNFPITSTVPITVFGGGITLQYSLVGLGVSGSIWPATSLNQTTTWQNGNAAISQGTAGTAQRITNNSPGATLQYTNNSTNRTANIQFGNETGITPFLFYIRLGIPVTSNFRFSNIQVTNLIV